MTILGVAQQVSLSVGIARPLTVFASPAREWQEMQSIANEAADVIANAWDWQRLQKVATVTGNAVAEAFDLPADFGRMQKDASLWSSRYRASLSHIVSPDEWLSPGGFTTPPIYGVWSIFGGQLHVRPIMGVGETVRFFYLSRDLAGIGKPNFTADTDTFVLSERLLKLCMVYLWKQEKGQDFAAELSDFEMALDQDRNRDQGSKPVLSGNMSARGRMGNVWPGTVGGAP